MLRTARVVGVHPEDYSVDLVMHDDNSRHVAVQVLAIGASSNTGLADMVAPTPTAQKWGQAERTDRDVVAVCAMLRGSPSIPVVVGFLYPQVCAMTFERKNFRVQRHASDWYTTVDDAGNFEAAHPSGTYFRIGTSAGHEDLTGQDFDKKWAIEKNTGSAVNVRLRVANAGVQKCIITINPSGDINLQHKGNLTTDTDGAANINIDGSATVHVGGSLTATVDSNASLTVGGTTTVTSTGAASVTAPSVTLTTPATHCTGNLAVDGSLTVGAGASITGGLTNNGKNVGSTHTHGGVDTGVGHTAVPD